MSATNDDNVYIKRGNKYIPFGRKCDENYLPDGIWYVRHDEHSRHCSSVDHYLSGLFKVGDAPQGFIDVPKLCKLATYTDYILSSPEFKKIQEKGYYSCLELVSMVVALVVNLNKKIKDDDDKRLKRNLDSLSR